MNRLARKAIVIVQRCTMNQINSNAVPQKDGIADWIGPCGKGQLYRMGGTLSDCAVKLIVRRDFDGGINVKDRRFYRGKQPRDIVQQQLHNLAHDPEQKFSPAQWSDYAFSTLNEEYKMASLLHDHPHMHPIKYFEPTVPVIYFKAPTGSLSTLKDTHLWDHTLNGQPPLALDRNFSSRQEPPAIGSHLWHSIAHQVVDVTRYLLEKGYAHLNLNPDTILYHGGLDNIHCWVTDYESITHSHAPVNPATILQNYEYTLPYNGASAQVHALAQTLCALLDLVAFQSANGKHFYITDKTSHLSQNIWTSIAEVKQEAALPSGHPLHEIQKIYQTFHAQMSRLRGSDNILEYGALAYLFMIPGRNTEIKKIEADLWRACDIMYTQLPALLPKKDHTQRRLITTIR
jgi:hypothetical protein